MKWNKKHLIIALLLPIQILLMRLAENNPAFIERFYSNGIYPNISWLLRKMFGWIPYSVGDVLLAIFILLFLRFMLFLIKNKFKNFLLKITHFISFLSIIYFCFYLFWGLNYYREPLAKNLGYEENNYTTDQLVKSTKFIIKKLNFYHQKITGNDTLKVEIPYSIEDLFRLSIKGYKNLETDFPQLSYHAPSVKRSLMSLLQSYNGTSGHLNPLTGEAQVNDKIPKTSFPTTACHEIAHQIGFSAENEANFVGFLAAKYNDNIYFKYASYRMAFGYSISEVRKRNPEISSQLWQTVNKGVLEDFNVSYEFWQQYKNPFEPLVKKGYNAYLKANKQAKGTDSYNYVVNLLISYLEETKQI